MDEVREQLRSTAEQPAWGVNGIEMSLFVTGAVSSRSTYGELLAKLFTREPYTPSETATVQRVAMGVSHSLEPDSALSSNVGYRAAMCQAYGQVVPEPSSDPIEAAFGAQVGSCPTGIAAYSSRPQAPTVHAF